MALAAYRHVLRSAQLAFQGSLRAGFREWIQLLARPQTDRGLSGDHLVLAAARKQARDTFEQNKTLQQGSEEVENGIKHAEDVARILRENIVQGEAAEKPDHYSTPTDGVMRLLPRANVEQD